MQKNPPSPLRRARIAAGISMAELARLAGTSRQHIMRLEKGESGKGGLPQHWAKRLAPHVHRSPAQLMVEGFEDKGERLAQMVERMEALDDDEADELMDFADFLMGKHGKPQNGTKLPDPPPKPRQPRKPAK